jgi:hypothetical protein
MAQETTLMHPAKPMRPTQPRASSNLASNPSRIYKNWESDRYNI